MAAVLTTSMTLRIILSVRGTLVQGGSFALTGSTAHTSSSRTTHVISTRSGGIPTNLSSQAAHTYTLDELRSKPEPEWVDSDNKSSVNEAKAGGILVDRGINRSDGDVGVKVTIDREVGYDEYRHAK